jgi:pyruvate dehydrogenase complex dehydrogenase (E1) component
VRFKALGVTDFACSGTPEELYGEMGIDAAGIARAVREVAGPAVKGAKKKKAGKAAKKPAKKAAKKKAKGPAKKKSAKKRKRS